MRLNLTFSMEMRVVCVQCGKDMTIEADRGFNPEPTLKCPDCGFKVRIVQAPRLPGVPRVDSRFPPLKPKHH